MDIAELVGRIREGEGHAPDPGVVRAALARERRRRHRRRLTAQVGSAAAAVAIVALAATAVVAARPGSAPGRPPAGGSHQAGTPSTGGVLPSSIHPPVTAADLAHYRWSTMPDAPIRTRDQAAIGWTGTEMIVWGGVADDGKTDVADGAAYNPATRTWRVLPAAPLGPRVPEASVWTGSEFVVWGGDHGQSDGAAYDPATNTWRAIPAVPGSTAVGGDPDFGTGAAAAWTGEVVQLLTWRYQGSAVQSWYYSPSRNTWTAGEPIRPKADALIGGAELLVRGSEVDAFVGWSYRDSGGLRDAVTAYARASGTATWHPVTYSPSLDRAGDLVDAGDEILMSGGQPFVGFHSSPAITVPGRRLDPATGTSTPLPDFPGLGFGGGYRIAWTGAALLGYGTDTYQQDPDGRTILPGAAAAWDPATDSWTPLPAAPLAAYGTSSGVWTGTELLSWGLMFPPDRANEADREVRAAGLVFGPAG
jgi:hypothetical protein